MEMRVYDWRRLSCALMLSLLFSATASAQYYQVFFSSGSWEINESQKTEILNVACGAESDSGWHITLTGHADPNGTAADNMQLAEQRCIAIKDVLISAGMPADIIFIEAMGERKADEHGDYRQHRRVDMQCVKEKRESVTAMQAGEKQPDEAKQDGDKMDILKLWNTIRNPAESFEIDPHQDNVITAKEGVLVLFPEGAFKCHANDDCKVRIEITVTMNKQDMVLNNLSTAYGRTFLESGGMVEIQAWYGSEPAVLTPGKSYLVMVPDQTPQPEMELFDGQRSPDTGVVQWTNRETSDFRILTSEQLFQCAESESSRCGFICRISSRLSKQYEARRKAKDLLSSLSCTEQLLLEQKFGPDALRLLTDALRQQLYKKYRVTNDADLGRAIREQAEKRESGLSSSLSYYTFSSTRFGLVNCDYFPRVAKDLLTMQVKVPKEYSRTQMMLAFPGMNVVMQPVCNDGTIRFPNIPAGKEAVLIAMRFDNDVISMGMETIVIGPLAELPVLEVTTVQALSMKLAALNDTGRNDLVQR